MPTRVIRLKAGRPTDGETTIDEQVSAAHRYYNKLVEIHREFADAREEAKRRFCPELPVADAAVEEATRNVAECLEKIAARNAAERRKRATPDENKELKAARSALKDARAALKLVRETARTHPEYQSRLAELVVEYQGTIIDPDEARPRRKGGKFKDARASCGVYCGTYLRIEAAIEQAVQDAMGEPVQFRRWNGGGIVGPQITPPLSIQAAFDNTDTRLRIERLPSNPNKHAPDKIIVWVRVASSERNPVWAKLPVRVAKGLLKPNDRIRWASVIRRQAGYWACKDPNGSVSRKYRPYYEWEVQLTVDYDEFRERATTGKCGVNIGWLSQDDGSLRVATVADDQGRSEHLDLPAKLLARFQKARDIQSIRDEYTNGMIATIRSFIAGAIPQWMTENTEHADKWKGPRRLRYLYDLWRNQRFDGDEETFDALSQWHVRESHLESYQIGAMSGAVRRRTALYQQFASRLRKTYAHVAVEDTDYTVLKRRARPEDEKSDNETAKRNCQIASPGELRKWLLHVACAAIVSAENITKTCHACGSLESWDQERHVTHTCSQCKVTWDRDVNAARNLLARATVSGQATDPARGPQPPAGESDTPEEPIKGGRWERRKVNRSQNVTQTPTEKGE